MKQEEALDILKMGHTAFVTGSAGSGKTYLVNHFLDWLAACKVPFAVTAATGIAATHLGGQTIHSWSGMGIKREMDEYDLDRLMQKQQLYKRWNETAVLVIDEISMLSADQLDLLNTIGKVMRRSDKPFGGMMVVFSGDFFQLPPISRRDEPPAEFAYEARAWAEARPVVCYLETRYRHEGDENFASALNAIRAGKGTDTVRVLLEERYTERDAVPEEITRLYTHNRDVDAENEEKLAGLAGEEKTYEMQTKGKKNLVEALQRGCLAPETLRLKVGAEVMFVKNDPARAYVNGTRGVVADFENGLPLVRTRSGRTVLAEPAEWRIEEDGKVKANIRQIPLRLAWAITVHKSQGLTLDEAYMELAGAFVHGQGYVALSRVRSLKGLYLGAVSEMALSIDERVLEKDIEFRTRSERARARLLEISEHDREGYQKVFVSRHKGTYVADASPRQAAAEDMANISTRVASHHKTRELVEARKDLEAIAHERGVKAETILAHIEKLLDEGVKLDLSHLDLARNKDMLAAARNAADKHGWERLAPLRSHIEKEEGTKVSYRTLRELRTYEMWRDMYTN